MNQTNVPKRQARSWADLSLRGKGFVVVAIPLAALFATIITAPFADRRQQDAQGWVEHTLLVQSKTLQALNLLANAESGVRGYIITGRPEFLQPVKNSKTVLALTLNQIDELTRDNPAQTSRLKRVRLLSQRQEQVWDS